MYHINKEITGSGENIALKNTAKHYFKNFDILGNSVQEGTPSIEFKAPIESVGDNINLFDGQTETGGIETDGSLNTATDRWRSVNYIDVRGFDTLTISLFDITTTGAIGRYNLYDENYSNLSHAQITATKMTIDVTNASYFKFWCLNAQAPNTTKIKICKGTKATPYSPYGQGSIEIKNANKNLFDISKYPFTKGVAYQGGQLVWWNGYCGIQGYFPVKENTEYNFSNNLGKAIYFGLVFYDKDKNIISNIDTGVRTFTTPKNCRYIRFAMDSATVPTWVQIEYGNTTTDYVAHQSQTKALYTQQPFRAIGDVKDRFVKKASVWYEEHKIFRKIFDGTENWLLGAPNYRYYIEINNKAEMSNIDITPLSSRFVCVSGTGIEIDYDTIWLQKLSDSSFRINIFNTNYLSDLANFKKWLTELYNAGTPVYVDYVLATPTLIECTPEQVEVLEYFEKEAYSYDEVTHIYSTDEVSPYFEVIAYQRISEEFKTRLKEGKITRGYLKVLATDTLPEIIIDENNYLKDLKIEELRYVPEEGIIGGTVAKRVSGNFNNVDSSFNIQDREIEVYLGVELEDETTEYIKYGTYIVQRPEDDQVNDNTSFEALDYMIKFNQEYKDRITYPCTLKQLLDDIIDQAGVNSKVSTFANSDFVVENNQFEQGSTLRDVLKAITQVAFNWSRIDADDNLVMDFETREETDEELGTDDYFSFKKSDDYGPVNVVILRNSQVEGENVTVKDEELINSPKGYNLLDISKFIKNNLPNVDVKYNSDGSLLLNGTTDAYGGDIRCVYEKPIKLIAGKYTFAYGIDGYEKFNNELNLTSLGNGTYQLVKKFAESFEKTIITFSSDFELYNYNIHLKPSTTFENYIIKPIIYKGEEEKPFQPYIPIGEIEYVISDNPFAYTELKRKQLIEAGRRLFGFKYTPMTVDMLGLMYLNSKDRISVENLNGQKYSTYLFDHTIDYTGIVLDSMESKSKSKTETKYQYVSSLAQGLSHVEIKVDKANKRIESIIESQEDVSEKVAKTVARIEVVYALSDSPTTAPTDGWSTTAPEWTAGKYMWQKTITTYANGTTAETAATNISGAKGEAGKNGIGITQTNITYQKSTSGTTVPTGTWQTTIPEVDEDGYLWTRTEFIYSDGSKKYAYNVGKKGATGIGVKSIIDQYYSSTSNTEVTGGEWKETQDTLQTDRFIWTRSKITWTNGSVTYTDPILANTLNDINSNIIVFKDFKATQESTNKRISSKVEETTKKLNDEYLTADKVNEKIDKIDDDYTILESRVAQTELDSKSFKVSIETIQNTGVDKIKTSMGYTFNDNGLNIDRTGSDTSTVIDEAKIKVTDKTGGQPKSLLYAGYVKEGDTEFSDYEGQTIVATSNLIVQNFLIIGSNSRFQDYYNETLGGNGTGAFDI